MFRVLIFIVFGVCCKDISIEYVPKRKTPPSPRVSSLMDYSPNTDSLFVFGGFRNSLFMNDMWTFNLTEREWENHIPLSVKVPGI